MKSEKAKADAVPPKSRLSEPEIAQRDLQARRHADKIRQRRSRDLRRKSRAVWDGLYVGVDLLSIERELAAEGFSQIDIRRLVPVVAKERYQLKELERKLKAAGPSAAEEPAAPSTTQPAPTAADPAPQEAVSFVEQMKREAEVRARLEAERVRRQEGRQ